jgi:hypothetical protein
MKNYSILPLKMKLAYIKYTMKRSLSNSGANIRLPPLKILKLQFSVLSPFTPLSSKENAKLPALRFFLGYGFTQQGFSTA